MDVLLHGLGRRLPCGWVDIRAHSAGLHDLVIGAGVWRWIGRVMRRSMYILWRGEGILLIAWLLLRRAGLWLLWILWMEARMEGRLWLLLWILWIGCRLWLPGGGGDTVSRHASRRHGHLRRGRHRVD